MPKKGAEEVTLDVPWGTVRGKCWDELGDLGTAKSGVLLLHGNQQNAASFDALVPLLPEGLYFAPDLPGHGLSSPLPLGLQLDFFHYILVVKRILDILGWTTCNLIGHSFGAQISTFFSAMFPERVRGYVALDALIPFMVPNSSSVEFARERIDMLDSVPSTPRMYSSYEEALERTMDSRHGRLTKEAAEALLQRCLIKTANGYKLSTDPRLRMSLRPLMTMKQINCFSESLRIPVMLLMAQETVEKYSGLLPDEFLVDRLNELRSKLPKLKVEFFPGDHFSHMTAPHLIIRFISEFLLKHKSSL